MPLILLGGCFEDPVEDRLEVALKSAGDARLEFSRELHYGRGSGPRFEARMRAVAQSTIDGSEPLISAFDSLSRSEGAMADGGTWERAQGRLTSMQRWLETSDPTTALSEVLGRGALNVSYSCRGASCELALLPSGEARATRAESQAFTRGLRAWATSYARYISEVGDLWGYLETRPDRAEPVLRHLFADLLDEEEEERPPLDSKESEMLERIEELETRLVAAFAAGEDGSSEQPEEAEGRAKKTTLRSATDSSSLQELSRRSFDPLPAELVVELPGTPSDVQGFLADGTVLRAPRPGLWQAWSALANLWLQPNPVALQIQTLGEEAEFQFDEVLAQQRRAPTAPLTAREIVEAFADSMRGPELYLARWEVPE